MNFWDPLKFEKDLLQNGISVYTNLTCPIEAIIIAIAYPVGSNNDPENGRGAAHFMEHWPFRGTANFPNKSSLALPIEERGGVLNAWTAFNEIVYWAKVAREDMGLACGILDDMTSQALLRDEDFEMERGVVLEEWKSQYAKPASYAYKILLRELFKGHPQHQLPIGDYETIRTFTPEDIRSFYRRVCCSGTPLSLFVVGGADKKEVMASLEMAFGKRTIVPHEARHPVPVPELGQKIVITDQPYSRTHLVMGAPAFSFQNIDLGIAADVFTVMLDEGLGSPLFDELREKRGLVYGSSFSYQGSRDVGSFYFGASTSFSKAEEVCSVFLETVHKVASDRSRFEMSKRLMKKSLRITEFGLRQILSVGMEDVMQGGRHPLSLKEGLEMIERVTLDDIRSLADQYLQKERFITVVVKSQTE